MNWKALLQGIATAAIGGAATAFTGAMADPAHVDLHHLAPTAGIGALVGVAALFRQSPIAAAPVNPPEPPIQGNFPQTK